MLPNSSSPIKTCAVNDCGNGGRLKRGWCSMHYQRFMNHSDPLQVKMPGPTVCILPDCGERVIARGWCENHYRHWQKYGDPLYSPRNFCKTEGCNDPVHEFGWCSAHFEEWRDGDPLDRAGLEPDCVTVGCENPREFLGRCAGHRGRVKLSTDPAKFVPAGKRCKFPDCPKPKSSLGYCNGHYEQHRKGKTLKALGGAALFADQRFFQSVNKTDECWEWSGQLNKGGYGTFSTGKTSVMAHRFSYELHVGVIPTGMQIDHRCHNHACVNPTHLRPATSKQNNEHRYGAERTNPTGHRGVSVRSDSGLYRARLTHNGVTVDLGGFKDPNDAAEVVRLKRLEVFTHSDRDRMAA